MNDQSIRGMLVAAMILLPSVSVAEPSVLLSSTPVSSNLEQVIVEIGGRFCEYLPRRVEAALFGYHPVQQVASVEGAISSGIGCRAWIDRGGR